MGFLARHPDGAILDEIQRAPDLVSHLQAVVDEDPRPGRFVLTGSRNLSVVATVSQSLAGRSALVELLPLSHEEVLRFDSAPSALNETLWTGGYPRILDRRLPPTEWLESYVASYVERDVRQLLQVGDLVTFQTFLRLCAGRVGQILNLSSLASDCGISHTTARAWLSVLEASDIVFRLPPFHANLGKRLVKAPKLYAHDTGLLCALLGIEGPGQLETHPLRGAVFESWVVTEVLKHHLNRGRRPRLTFYRERNRAEIDLLIERGTRLVGVEAKSSRTPAGTLLAAFPTVAAHLERDGSSNRLAERIVVYGGDETQRRSQGLLLPWSAVAGFDWLGPADGPAPRRSRA